MRMQPDVSGRRLAMNMMPRQPDDIAARILVEVTTDAADVAEQWAALEPYGTVFQTRAWLLPWYRLIAPEFGALALFVSVRDRSTHRPLMLLPLCRRRRHGVVTIEFPDLEVSDYNSPLQAPDFHPDAGGNATALDGDPRGVAKGRRRSFRQGSPDDFGPPQHGGASRLAAGNEFAVVDADAAPDARGVC